MKNICLFVLVSLASVTGLSQDSFDAVGPYGGWINVLTPDQSGNIYAGTYFGGIFKTTDAGVHWTQLYNDTLVFDAQSVAINASGHIFAGLSPGFLRSTDGGGSWQKVSNALNTRTVTSLVVLPNGNILAGTVQAGVYRSTDNGSTFSQISNGLPGASISSLAVNGTNYYVATYGDGVYRSSDGGANWTPANNGITGNLMKWVGAGPTGILYTTGGTSIFRSTNDGDNWADIGAPSSQGYNELAFTTNAIYAATQKATILGGDIFKSTDNGATWAAESGLPNMLFTRIVASGNTVLAGSGGRGVYRSDGTDAGQDTWTHAVSGMTNTHVMGMGHAASGDLYAATQLAGMFRSTDTGLTWFEVSNGIPATERLAAMAVSPVTGTVFVGGAYGGYRSSDQGASWTSASLGGVTAIACNAQGHVFAGFGSFVNRSTDNGDSWTFSSIPTVQNIAAIAFKDDTVYVATGVGSGFGTSRGVYRSTDNGGTWAPMNDGLSNLNVTAISLIGPSQDRIRGTCASLFAGTYGGGVFGYDGAAWIQKVSGLQDLFLRGLINGPDFMIAATFSGMYRLDIVACAWTLIARVTEIRSIELVGASLVALAGTFGRGIFRGSVLDEVDGPNGNLPGDLTLAQNYPNPFNPTTRISFSIHRSSFVSLRVYDVLGNEVTTLVNGEFSPGRHSIDWNAGGVASGVYFYRLTAGGNTQTRKLVVVK